ncbi:MAG: hypothetical protein ACUVV0_13585 [Anaerolineae bacterium]
MVSLLTRKEMEERLGRVFTPEQMAGLVDVLEMAWQAADTRELKQGLAALTGETKNLAEAQLRTEERIETLAESQLRTQEQVAILAEAQRRTEERIDALAEAQRRTEERIDALAEAQRRTEEQVAALAEAQRQMSESMTQLSTSVDRMARGLDDLRLHVGRLANTFGFDFEEFVSALLPPYLEQHFGITKLFLEREYFPLPDESFGEVDLVGDCYWNGEPAVVLVECSVTIGGSRVRDIAEKFEKVAAHLQEWKGKVKIVRIIVSMNVHPTAKEAGKETGIWIIPYHDIYWERGPRTQMNVEKR